MKFIRTAVLAMRIQRLRNKGLCAEQISNKLGTDLEWTRAIMEGTTQY